MRRQMKKLLLLSIFLSAFLIVVTVDYLSGETRRHHFRPVSSVAYTNHAILESSKQGKVPTFVSRPTPAVPVEGVLLPDWEVLVLLPPFNLDQHGYNKSSSLSCLFRDGIMSPASFSGVLPWSRRQTFKCTVPSSLRWRRQQGQRQWFNLPAPVLVDPCVEMESGVRGRENLHRWDLLVYESYSMVDDVVVFAKGVNSRQNNNRPPSDLRCMFRTGNLAVTTIVTSSVQEVFRCHHPEMSNLPVGPGESIKVSLEFNIKGTAREIPSIAKYRPLPPSAYDRETGKSSLLCACTMVNNVGKFLPEWITYHSAVGVDRFFLYDNNSDDDLDDVVDDLSSNRGIDITTYRWPWPKTQEAGFSHCAVSHRQSCKWMMFLDVDEFAFAPNWLNSTEPSTNMLKSILPRDDEKLGQLMINCQDYGPSGQTKHPPEGVIQGYTCRRKLEERHKSILKLDAVDGGLLNVVHHFNLSVGFYGRRMSSSQLVVNHYKYQAWSEFRAKFRRRVSTYVVDWTEAVKPGSKDRTPGLGFEPIEPKDWTEQFCDVRDTRLKDVTKRWFDRVRTMAKTISLTGFDKI